MLVVPDFGDPITKKVGNAPSGRALLDRDLAFWYTDLGLDGKS